MKIESNKNWTTCLRLNTGDGSPRVFLLNSHFLGSVPINLFLLNLFYQYLMTPVKSNNKKVSQIPVRSSCHQVSLTDFSSNAMKTYIMKLINVMIMRIGMMKMAINSPPGTPRLVMKIHCGTNPSHINTSAILFAFSSFIKNLQPLSNILFLNLFGKRSWRKR